MNDDDTTGDRDVTIELSSPSVSAAIGANATAKLHALHIDDLSIPEGDSGTANATFHVTVGAPLAHTFNVAYTTENATRLLAGSDYQATSGTLIFSPGDTSKSIAVPIFGRRERRIERVLLDASDAPACCPPAVAPPTVKFRRTATILNDDYSLAPQNLAIPRGTSALLFLNGAVSSPGTAAVSSSDATVATVMSRAQPSARRRR